MANRILRNGCQIVLRVEIEDESAESAVITANLSEKKYNCVKYIESAKGFHKESETKKENADIERNSYLMLMEEAAFFFQCAT